MSRWVVVIVLWFIIASIATGKAGISNFMDLIKERDVLKLSNLDLKKQNQDIESQINLLKNSVLAQKRYIKGNFGYTEEGEFVYQYKSQ